MKINLLGYEVTITKQGDIQRHFDAPKFFVSDKVYFIGLDDMRVGTCMMCMDGTCTIEGQHT